VGWGDLDYIFIDEVSMLGEVFYKFLMMIKKIRPDIIFIISGDYDQLSPVNDRISNILIILIPLVCLSFQITINCN
jgi:ATP-dependent exoDNAse (exonuclease V) alpha subunit